jgi:hypothetical protein
MNFIVALLLLHLDEEDSFWVSDDLRPPVWGSELTRLEA